MPERAQTPAQRFGWGIGLAFAGGLSMIGSVQVLEGGTLNIGTLLQMNIGGGTAGVTVHDGGASLRCDPRWVIGSFEVGRVNYLEKEMPVADENRASSGIEARVRDLAANLVREAPPGNILLVGSGDEGEDVRENARLALGRARMVKRSLARANAAYGSGARREILIGNESLVQPGESSAGPDGGTGLARLLYGQDEYSGRNVRACVLQPLPHAVEAWQTQSEGARWWMALTAGVILGILAGWLPAFLLLRKEREATSPPVQRTVARRPKLRRFRRKDQHIPPE